MAPGAKAERDVSGTQHRGPLTFVNGASLVAGREGLELGVLVPCPDPTRDPGRYGGPPCRRETTCAAPPRGAVPEL